MKKTLLTIILLLSFSGLTAQRRNQTYQKYIDKYSSLAVREMKRHHIPASITLAQGLLESGAGRSRLSRLSNNHFGIKCGGNWSGRKTYADDDYRNECFRSYKHPRESYEDHSRFLVTGPRYQFLFRLKPTDYKGWARGLKKAGYATNPHYADRLINIIELYNLQRYDRRGSHGMPPAVSNPHQPYLANDLLYIIARSGDTWKTISREFGISRRRLRKYNDLYKGYELSEGDIVYLEKKRRKALSGYIIHRVSAGESMHSISQMYGIRLKNLYKLNKKTSDYHPREGDYLRLR